LYISSPCNDGNVNTVNDTISSSCICIGKLKGCINPSACNYNALAEVDNGTCKFIGAVCNDNNSNTINDIINQNCVCAGVSVLPGNTTCQNEYISVTGCGGQDSLLYYDRYYSLVEIGGQCWFAENLATDKYANGDTIPTGLDNYTWINAISCAFAIYNDDLANDVIYGKLYNWFTTVDSRGVCPTGWHVPTDCDWMFLETSLGLSLQEVQSQGARGTDEGGALKSVSGWYGDNTGATNSSLFFALPGGVRSIYINNVGNSYGSILLNGVWWTSNSLSLLNAFSRSLTYEEATIDRNALNKTFGVSIRCIKD
jgi:uncharacterized protein (TIGR02145 family)